jgi:hypothetical protein
MPGDQRGDRLGPPGRSPHDLRRIDRPQVLIGKIDVGLAQRQRLGQQVAQAVDLVRQRAVRRRCAARAATRLLA